LHGDFWAGNYMVDRYGAPWLIDPATYVGHAEADIAMTELFGGFDQTFYGAYKEAAGLSADYRDRRDLYNLYHLLNHLNLFGGSYLSSVLAILHRYA
jgi:fructosamine-3-kinase